MSEKVVVAGAGFAGVNSALELARRGYDVELIDQKGYHLFTPALPDFIGGKISEEKLRLNLAGFFSGTSVDFSREKIVGFDPENDLVETSSGAHSYDHLVVALGYDVRSFGMNISEALTAYTLEDAKQVVESAEDSEDAIVVGGGYVGVEVASELRSKDLEVTLVDQVTRPMPRSGSKVSESVLEYLNSADISFRGGKAVEEVEKQRVVLEDGSDLSADMVIWVGGMQASKLVQRDFGCGKSGLDVNSGLNSSEYDNVFAAGPCADTEGSMTAHYSIQHAEVIAENVGRSENQSLKEFEPGKRILVLSLGKKGLLEYGEKAYTGRIFRYLETFIRHRYWTGLRWKKLKLRLTAQ
jgi:NADH dehydrogenase FAD-containing subunit